MMQEITEKPVSEQNSSNCTSEDFRNSRYGTTPDPSFAVAI